METQSILTIILLVSSFVMILAIIEAIMHNIFKSAKVKVRAHEEDIHML